MSVYARLLWRVNPESIATAAEYGFRIALSARPE